MNSTRRQFLKTLLTGMSSAVIVAGPVSGPRTVPRFLWHGFEPDAADPWDQLPRILARIKEPVFPKRYFDITRFGAAGDNRADCTTAFQKAIAACNAAGGGRVVVPAGEFLTGAIRLKSNVELHLEQGSTIRFSRDTWKYPLVFTRWEG